MAISENLFGRGRRRLTMLYSLVMIIFLAVILFVTHRSMEWSIASEQARELSETVRANIDLEAVYRIMEQWGRGDAADGTKV